MNYQESNKELWDEHFSKTSLDYPNEEVVRFLASCRKHYPNGKMLDWGCATGRHTILGCKMGYQVMAVDYVERCVNITKTKVEENEYQDKILDYIVNKDIDVEKIEDEYFDIILIFGVLFYNNKESQMKMLENASRMLKKGGRIFADFRTVNDDIYVKAKKQGIDMSKGAVIGKESHLAGQYMCILTLDEIEHIIETAGLTVEKTELCEFTENNRTRHNSWWHITMLKE